MNEPGRTSPRSLLLATGGDASDTAGALLIALNERATWGGSRGIAADALRRLGELPTDGQEEMNEPTLEAVMHRLQHLEREQPWWKGVGLAALAVLRPVVRLGATKGKARGIAGEIRPRPFVVLDGNEKLRFVLGRSNHDDSGLVLIMEDRRSDGELSLLPLYGSPALALYDQESRGRAYLAVNDWGSDSSELEWIAKEEWRPVLSTGSGTMRGPADVSFANNQIHGSIGAYGGSVQLRCTLRESGKVIIERDEGIAERRLGNGSPSRTLADRYIQYPGIVLGHATLESPCTDIQEKWPASFLVLWNQEGKFFGPHLSLTALPRLGLAQRNHRRAYTYSCIAHLPLPTLSPSISISCH